MRAKDAMGVLVGLAAVVAVVVLLEKQYDVGDAWVGIVGVIGGALVTLATDRVRARADSIERRSEWIRERRFAAYEETLRALSRTRDRLAETGDENDPSFVELEMATIAVVVYGSGPARKTLKAEKQDGETGLEALDRMYSDLAVQVSIEVHAMLDGEEVPDAAERLKELEDHETGAGPSQGAQAGEV